MTQNDLLKDLKTISSIIGNNSAYVQGGGGNTSVKLDEERMAVKASGWLLSDVTEKDGYSIVDYKAIREYLRDPDESEEAVTSKIKSFAVETNNRPSIETGFHALLGNCIIHTHSVYANLLACSKKGIRIAKELFPDSIWVDYSNPGRALTLAVKSSIVANPHSSSFFLQNHGVIVSADNAQKALDIHESINKKIQEYFNIPEDDFDPDSVMEDLDFIKDHVLFPDQVVYTLAGAELLKTRAAKETLAAYRYIFETIEKNDLIPNFIEKENVEILSNMEGEKYRQKALKK